MTRWHQPGTLAVDRAREVARTLYTALARVDPQAAELIARVAADAGEGWLAPQIARHGPDDEVTPAEAAELVGRSTRWVYAWVAQARAQRSVIGSDGRIRVRIRDVRDALAAERRRGAPPG